MTFEEILDQAVAMLQRRGRVAYRTLKVQFRLDDDALEALKDELIYAQKLGVDEGARVLVWTGETEPKPESASAPPAQQEVIQEEQSTQIDSPPPESPTPDAERRQLTVMFCDLVGSTPLSEQLDPEDLREVVRAYQQTCAEVVQRFDGHITQLLGDALLVYFGWPQAHEDDAQRAVRTGLDMLEAMQTLNTRLGQDKGIRLAIRVGIHTGLVVVGEMGGGGHQEQLALGDTPNVASRMQGIAEPDTVVISEATYRLVQGYFTCQDMGEQSLKGIAEPMQVYRVVGESGAQSRLDATTTRGLTPLVGRESEVILLLERWNQVQDGMGQVVLLSGEAGIGKSRLVQVLTEHVITAQYGQDLGVVCRSYAAYALGHLGFVDEALHKSHEAMALAQELAHPLSLAWALHHAARFHQCRREDRLVHERAEASMALYTELGPGHYVAAGTILRGWAEGRQEQGEAGIAHMRQGLAARQAMEVALVHLYFLALLAEAHGHVGQAEEGLSIITEALALVNKTGERWCEAELHRLKGELLLSQPPDNQTEAETCFHKSLDVARHQQAKSWELRAATSLARLWQQQGKRQEAYDLLAPVYGWFTEGFDTADLKEAKALLDELA